MASTLFFVLALAASAAARPSNMSSVSTKEGEPDGNIDLNSPLLLDDMLFVDGQLEQGKTGGVNGSHLLWPGGIVYYVIEISVALDVGIILAAFQEYHTKTCIRFMPRVLQTNYIRIFAGPGCFSNVGMVGGRQPVSLGEGCIVKGTIIHELGHVIGFYHEQNRSDRDQYLTIYWENIQQGMESQFALLAPNQNLLFTPFDYNSIMIYGNYAFSKDLGSMTMEAKNGARLLDTYDKSALSPSDITSINKMYNCPSE